MTDARLESKLGFDKVRKAVSDRCMTDYAAGRVAEEDFCTDPSIIRQRLALTDEMRLILMFEENFPTTGYIDAIPFLSALERAGSSIDVLSLGKLKTVTDTLRRILQELVNRSHTEEYWKENSQCNCNCNCDCSDDSGGG